MAISLKISDLCGKSALVGAAAIVLLVAGCGKKEADRPAGQVIAHVGGDEVTIQELENELRLANVPANKRNDAVTRAALLEIITRKSVARQALTGKLDREPTIQLDLLRDKEQLLARTFQQRKLSGAVAGIGQSDIDQFIVAHPDQFAKRVIFVTDQIEIPAQAVTAELGAATKESKTLAEVEKKLGELKIPFRRGAGALDAATLPASLTQQLKDQKADNVFFARVASGGVYFRIVEMQPKPLSGNDASNLARQMISREKFEGLNRQAAADATKAATFEGEYVKIMADAPAKEAPAKEAPMIGAPAK